MFAVAFAALLAGCGGREPEPRPAEPGLRVGLAANTVGYGAQVGEEQDRARALGVGWLREDLTWSQIEPRPGERRWARFDRLFEAAAERELRILPLLTGTPGWATPSDGGLPLDAAAYGRLVGDAVARYGVGGNFWRARPRLDARLAPRWFELWNEPFLVEPQLSAADADRYAALVAAATAAGRARLPQARFLLALDASSASRQGVDARWVDLLLGADPRIFERVDGLSVHPYGIDEEGEGLAPLDSLLATLARHDVRLPLWITEVGWSTCSAEPVCVSERVQAERLAHLLAALPRYRDDVRAVFVYHLRDFRGDRPGGREGAFGLLRRDNSRKPAWQVLHDFAAG